MSVRAVFRAFILGCICFGLGCGTGQRSQAPVSIGEDSAAVRAMEAGVRGQAMAAEAEAPDEEALRMQAERVSEEDLEVFSAGVRAVAAAEDRLLEEGRDLESLKRSARSAGEARRAEQQVLEAMQEALGEAGLELESFLVMGQYVRQNPFLIERLREHLEDEEIARFYGVEVQDSSR